MKNLSRESLRWPNVTFHPTSELFAIYPIDCSGGCSACTASVACQAAWSYSKIALPRAVTSAIIGSPCEFFFATEVAARRTTSTTMRRFRMVNLGDTIVLGSQIADDH